MCTSSIASARQNCRSATMTSTRNRANSPSRARARARSAKLTAPRSSSPPPPPSQVAQANQRGRDSSCGAANCSLAATAEDRRSHTRVQCRETSFAMRRARAYSRLTRVSIKTLAIIRLAKAPIIVGCARACLFTRNDNSNCNFGRFQANVRSSEFLCHRVFRHMNIINPQRNLRRTQMDFEL